MKTIQKITKASLYLFLAVTLIIGCKKDKDSPKPSPINPPVNEEELITTVKITFVDTAGVEPTVTVFFRDPDGDGGNAPTQFDTIRLAANTIYSATIELFDESKNPVENITQEIQDEADEHIFCFTPTNVNLSIIRTDSDGTYEIGLTSQWTTGTTSVGTTQVVLKHQPSVKDGTCGPGDTDVELNFVTEIQ
ncbi:MAG: hypothetical protein CVT95_00510 [Bacteroidetes bacterium HGW-Bacteroidetes-12]|nr:MAG: hypothetical protein CVT95_00510 [Bacteroidetes bacterium HGW-Bacteroidetes-12]